MRSTIVNELSNFAAYEVVLSELSGALFPESCKIVYENIARPCSEQRRWIKLNSHEIGQCLLSWEGAGGAHFSDLLNLCERLRERNHISEPKKQLQLCEAGAIFPEFEYTFVVCDAALQVRGHWYLAPLVGGSLRLAAGAGQLKSLVGDLRVSAILSVEIPNETVHVGQSVELALNRIYLSSGVRKHAGTVGRAEQGWSFVVEEEQVMSEELDVEEIQGALPIELCLGELELCAQDLLNIRPGTQIEFEAHDFETVLKFGNTEWARGTVSFVGDKCRLQVTKVLSLQPIE